MSSTALQRAAPMVFPAVGRHTATVLFAHGLGDTAAGWAHAVQFWRRDRRLDEVKFVLPNAPVRPITLNGGLRMPGWFDMHGLLPSPQCKASDASKDHDGILESRDYIETIIKDEVSAGIPGDRIVIGGFSQGALISVFATLASPVKLAGAVCLSSFFSNEFNHWGLVADNGVNKTTPVFMGHGDEDDIICLDFGKRTESLLKEHGFSVTFKTYKGVAHSASLEELQDVAAFLAERLPPQAS
ncbi:hypothetical protein CDD80_1327 [Ophiocordyceps camponoti-rufipedis]|uniref:Acyl-protein thioesterase 1 n=1 Tax=Ophiocordyceps camponoti-rufipedis TaxID=2004952 RepID=A0A2C5XMB5_9HYPO|nr:hypothetical protein CDD80_1327 [Ophiocordyceps camponoti-rufipedis]